MALPFSSGPLCFSGFGFSLVEVRSTVEELFYFLFAVFFLVEEVAPSQLCRCCFGGGREKHFQAG